MAPQGSQQMFTPLRVVTQRLAATPAQRLPHVVPSLVAVLSETKGCFQAAQSDSEPHSVSEGVFLVHKLKTQISALLQDRSAEARYAAVVLIKTIVEVGGWSILQGSNPWIKDMIGLLGRRNSSITEKLSVLTLTKMFILTHGYPSLVRELTTPSLAGFISACLNLIRGRHIQNRDDFLAVVMLAFDELVPRHPASFRPFCAQIKNLILPLLAPVPSDTILRDEIILPSIFVSDSARRLHVSLSICEPKNASSEEWAKGFRQVIETTHRTANLVFRALIEDIGLSSSHQDLKDLIEFEDVVQDAETRAPGLTPWTGISAGVERLDGLLKTLGAFLSTPSFAALVLPVGELVKVIERILSALPPTKDTSVRTRPEISRDEREGLFVGLPRLHASAIHLCSLLLSRMGRDAATVSILLLDQMLWTLDRVTSYDGLRRAAYETISHILHLFGSSVPRSCAPGLSSCIKLCCEDLLPSSPSSDPEPGPSIARKHTGSKNSAPRNTNHFLTPPKPHSGTSYAPNETKIAAITFLTTALTTLPKGFISSSLRQQIDRTAILTDTKDLMFASVMNPPAGSTKASSSNSLLPFLARAFPSHLEVEALVRPRMPPIKVHRSDGFGPEEDGVVDPKVYDDDSDVAKDPQISAWRDEGALAELKRQRQGSEEVYADADAELLVGNGLVFEGWPQYPKRQKIASEASAPASGDASLSNAQPAAHVAQPVEERLSNDDPMDNPFAKAVEVEESAESGLEIHGVEAVSSEPDTQNPPVPEVTIGVQGDDDDESDDEIPVLEMESDDDDDEEDEDENEGDGKETMG